MCSKQGSFILFLISLSLHIVTGCYRLVTPGYGIIRGLTVKESSFISSLISLWLHMIKGGYSIVTQCYVSVRGFDEVKTAALFLPLYLFGYTWLQVHVVTAW